MKYKSKRHGLTLQWRLALTSAAILAAACLILTLVFNHSAGTELDDLEIQVIRRRDLLADREGIIAITENGRANGDDPGAESCPSG